jgi:hypothetical protein
MLRHKIKLKTGTKIENAIIEAHLDSLTLAVSGAECNTVIELKLEHHAA